MAEPPSAAEPPTAVSEDAIERRSAPEGSAAEEPMPLLPADGSREGMTASQDSHAIASTDLPQLERHYSKQHALSQMGKLKWKPEFVSGQVPTSIFEWNPRHIAFFRRCMQTRLREPYSE
eukprot:TRINITY_DN91203_c0_g1_i1.p2 TRINITY_DN91203_c0_g1~~TRINITY_DN91203_c0_g1_i1.p2  ORF type:complete len:134 (-),score=21.76 TRINITY_DN91203_c0_g1_i1:39-398(-)